MTSEAPAPARGVLVLALRRAGVRDVDLLRAIETLPREIFAPERLRDLAGRNTPLPIACGQTMEAPEALAIMLEALELQPGHRVLEIGAGSGYSTAILSRLVREVVAYERFAELARDAQARLDRLGFANASVRHGDGMAECAQGAPFDRIVVHARLDPPLDALVSALAPDGALVCAMRDAEGQGEAMVLLRAKYREIRKLGPIRASAILSGASAGCDMVNAP